MTPRTGASDRTFPVLDRATQRHVRWACDYIAVGDLESAIEALQDACAAQGERRLGEPDVPLSAPAAARRTPPR